MGHAAAKERLAAVYCGARDGSGRCYLINSPVGLGDESVSVEPISSPGEPRSNGTRMCK